MRNWWKSFNLLKAYKHHCKSVNFFRTGLLFLFVGKQLFLTIKFVTHGNNVVKTLHNTYRILHTIKTLSDYVICKSQCKNKSMEPLFKSRGKINKK